MIALFLIIEGLGLYSTRVLQSYFNDVANHHAALVINSEMIRTDLAKLRYAEKDLFLHVKEPVKIEKYKALWDKSYANVLEHAEEMSRIQSDSPEETEKDHQMVRSITNLDVYQFGFNSIVAQIRGGYITDTHVANKSIQPYKDVVSEADKLAECYATTLKIKLDKSVVSAISKSTRIQKALVALSGVAFILAVVLTALLIRSITKGDNNAI